LKESEIMKKPKNRLPLMYIVQHVNSIVTCCDKAPITWLLMSIYSTVYGPTETKHLPRNITSKPVANSMRFLKNQYRCTAVSKDILYSCGQQKFQGIPQVCFIRTLYKL
jgi:hypothetical protein